MKEIFCKTTINEIMPAVRAVIAVNMLKRGFTQKEISKKLGITQPAISQYKKSLRGGLADLIKNNKEMNSYINKLTDEVAQKGLDISTVFCDICEKTRKTNAIKTDPNKFLCLLEMAEKRDFHA